MINIPPKSALFGDSSIFRDPYVSFTNPFIVTPQSVSSKSQSKETANIQILNFKVNNESIFV